jgi:hypothetical protein
MWLDKTTQCPFLAHEVRRRVWTHRRWVPFRTRWRRRRACPDQTPGVGLSEVRCLPQVPGEGPIQSIRLTLVHPVGCEAWR